MIINQKTLVYRILEPIYIKLAISFCIIILVPNQGVITIAISLPIQGIIIKKARTLISIFINRVNVALPMFVVNKLSSTETD